MGNPVSARALIPSAWSEKKNIRSALLPTSRPAALVNLSPSDISADVVPGSRIFTSPAFTLTPAGKKYARNPEKPTEGMAPTISKQPVVTEVLHGANGVPLKLP